ncbi:MAG: CPBP family intramembrane metalloprotease [Anaerolineae bacterium]|jgi:membrane protease YdiL (CAAX protease family)
MNIPARRIRPLPIWQAAFFFAAPAALLFICVYHLTPRLIAMGISAYLSLNVAFLLPFALLFCLSLVAYGASGDAWSWAGFKERYRLGPMSREDRLWTGGLLIFGATVYLSLRAVLLRLVGRGIVVPPDSVPAILDPRVRQSVGALMGGWVRGNWPLALVSVGTLFFNVAGEELWWRGYILPRQEAAHGRHAWVPHGVLWTLFHAFKYWEFAALLPVCLGFAFVAQRRRSTWPTILAHAALNGVESIYVVLLVVGVAAA